MEEVDEEMLHILSMDPHAYVGFSDYSKSWYVHLNLGEKLEFGSCSIPTHAPTPSGRTGPGVAVSAKTVRQDHTRKGPCYSVGCAVLYDRTGIE